MKTTDINPAISKKPGAIKAILILTIFKIVLSFGFYVVFSIKGSLLGIDPSIILYTASAYVLLSIPIFYFISKRNALGLRIALVLDFASSLPIYAFIGLLISAISFGLTFGGASKKYFNQ